MPLPAAARKKSRSRGGAEAPPWMRLSERSRVSALGCVGAASVAPSLKGMPRRRRGGGQRDELGGFGLLVHELGGLIRTLKRCVGFRFAKPQVRALRLGGFLVERRQNHPVRGIKARNRPVRRVLERERPVRRLVGVSHLAATYGADFVWRLRVLCDSMMLTRCIFVLAAMGSNEFDLRNAGSNTQQPRQQHPITSRFEMRRGRIYSAPPLQRTVGPASASGSCNPPP